MSSSLHAGHAPNLENYLLSLKTQPLESSIENLISMLKRRQVKNSKPCAVGTVHLLLRVVVKFRWTDVGKLLERVKHVGRRLVEAQPREVVVGNIVRRVLGMIRDEAKEDRMDDNSDSAPNSQMSSPRRARDTSRSEGVEYGIGASSPLRVESADNINNIDEDNSASKSQLSRPPLMTSHTSYAVLTGSTVQHSMFNLLSATASPTATPPHIGSLYGRSALNPVSLARSIAQTSKDLKAEIISGIEEIIDELDQVDDQIAGYAQEHIHSNEVVLTHTSSRTVQKFLLKAADKRKFTVIIAESYPNDHEATHATVAGTLEAGEELSAASFLKPLAAAGVTVILVTDAAIFAIMSRVNKVILATHAVIANGGLVAAAGARIIAKAAKVHRTPVIVVSGVYKLSPEYPFEFGSLIEYGDPGKVISYEDGPLVERLDVDNPLYDYVPPDLVDLYITNLGAHAPSFLYRIVADHYKPEDINFHKPELQF